MILRGRELLISASQSLVQFCGIAANLYGDALNSVARHAVTSLKPVKIRLRGQTVILAIVVPRLDQHVGHHADGQQF